MEDDGSQKADSSTKELNSQDFLHLHQNMFCLLTNPLLLYSKPLCFSGEN